ncbi:MAG: hypothetical protein JRJ86_22005 [Deltaproteobacteria bacterium]|nr:hypothetical protein [Deltaproteobacteria bacterium]
MMVHHVLKSIKKWIYFLVVLSPFLIAGETSWGKNTGSTNQVVIVYSGNTLGFTKPTG